MSLTATSFPYIDAELDLMDDGAPPPDYWRHLHWGYFTDPDRNDDSLERYVDAAERMTEQLLAQARIVEGATILDVGCGFGGTLDHIRTQRRGCSLHGVNIDHRQLRWADRLLNRPNDANAPINFVTGDACALPYPPERFDHITAVECAFHFPSRKTFFRQAAATLKPGGTLTLSDFLITPGSLNNLAKAAPPEAIGDWYGYSTRPLNPIGYARLGRGVGLQLTSDRDVTAHTLPTYPALRRVYAEAGHDDGVPTVNALEALATTGGWEYHLLTFTK